MTEKIYKVIIKNPQEFGRVLRVITLSSDIEEIVIYGISKKFLKPTLGVTSRVDLAKLEEILEENSINFSVEE